MRVWVSIDWAKAPAGITRGSVKIAGAGREETIDVTARKPSDLTRDTLNGFVESAGYVSMNASHFTSKTDVGQAGFRLVEQYGMRTDAPVDVQGLTDRPHMDYRMYLFTPGEATAQLRLGPALNFAPERAVRIAVSMDNEAAPGADHRPARVQRRQRQPRLGAIGSRQCQIRQQQAPDRGARLSHLQGVDGGSRA